MPNLTHLRTLAQACIDAGVHSLEDYLAVDGLCPVKSAAYEAFLRALTPELIRDLASPITVVNTEKMDLDELKRIFEDGTSGLEFHPALPTRHLEFTPVETLHSSGSQVYRVGEGANDQAEVLWRADIKGHLDLHGCTTQAQAMRAARWYHGLYGQSLPGEVGDPYRAALPTKVTETTSFSYEVSETVTVNVNVEGEGSQLLSKEIIAALDKVRISR